MDEHATGSPNPAALCRQPHRQPAPVVLAGPCRAVPVRSTARLWLTCWQAPRPWPRSPLAAAGLRGQGWLGSRPGRVNRDGADCDGAAGAGSVSRPHRASSGLALLVCGDSLTVWSALGVRGRLLSERRTRLDRQHALHRTRLRRGAAWRELGEPPGEVALRILPVRLTRC